MPDTRPTWLRRRQYSRAMAMPPLARWRPFEGARTTRGSRRGYELTFEGRTYAIHPVRYLGQWRYLLTFSPAPRGPHGWLGPDGKVRYRATVHSLYRNPAAAAASARRYAAVQGWSSRSR